MASTVYTSDEMDTFWLNVDRQNACWLWTGPEWGEGYGRSVRDYAHRVSWESAAKEQIPEGLVVGHTCDIRRCVRNDDQGTYLVRGIALPRWGHLFLGTHADNLADRDDKGRGAWKPGVVASGIRVPKRGSDQPNAKLTEDDARAIITTYRAGGVLQRELAERYGIHQSIVSEIINGKRWPHVLAARSASVVAATSDACSIDEHGACYTGVACVCRCPDEPPTPPSDQERDEILLARLITEQTAHATRLRLTGWERGDLWQNPTYSERAGYIARLQMRMAVGV